MTDAPTTRETADHSKLQKMQIGPDHAELARLAEAATQGEWRVAEDNNPFADGRHVFAKGLDGTDFVVLNLKTDHTFVTATSREQQQRNALFAAAANPATVLALLSEIAALRGERDHFEAEFRHQCGATADQMDLAGQAAHELDAVSSAIGTVRFMDPPDGGDVPLSEQVRRMSSALTQAERQRDELRKALERIADEAPYRSGYCQSDVEYGPTLSADEMQAVARQALANQGADQ